MGKAEEVAAQVIHPLSAHAKNVVADAFMLVVKPEESYDESEVAIEKLEFASFAVGGLAAAADDPGGGAVRASSHTEIPLSDSAGGSDSAGMTVSLFGPGDVRGVESGQIVRRYPAPGTPNAEETVLAHVEFDRPEMPWQFSAAAPVTGMRPWLTLVVVERSTVEWEPATGLLPVLRVPLAELPPLADAHLWAHAQAPQSDTVAVPVRLSPEYAPVNLSRLLSPRVLTQDTTYLAALVPTTEVGARGGLGLVGGSLGPAWTSASDDPVRLPVYDSWEFRTGPDGDFATLALKLDGVVAPYQVGRRFIDTSQPGAPLDPLPEDAPGAKQVLRCALFSPTPPPTPELQVAETAAWPATFTDALHHQLNLPAEIEGTLERTGDIPDLPILGPRIYAKLQRGTAVVTGDDWFSQLNLAPTGRIVAGLGTRVVQRDQEQLMQAAWAQLGEVEKANRAILLAQVGEMLAQRIYTRLDALKEGHLLQVLTPLAARISLAPGRTLAADISSSATPFAAVSGAFRRAMRPAGPVVGRAATESRVRAGNLVGEDGLRDFTRTYRNPDGIGALSAEAIASLDHSLVARGIGVSVDDVRPILTRAGDVVGNGLAASLTDPSTWHAPDRGLDPAALLAEQWSMRLLREPSVPAIAAIRTHRVGPLAAELATGLASSAVTGTALSSRLRTELEEAAISINNSLIDQLEGRVAGGAGGPVAGGVTGPVAGGVTGPFAGGVAGPVAGGVAGPVAGGVVGPVAGGLTGGIAGGVTAGPIAGVKPGTFSGGVPHSLRDTAIRRSPIGGAVGRIGVSGVSAGAPAAAGRITVQGMAGVSRIDTTPLQRVPAGSTAAARAGALRSLAGLAPVRLTPLLDQTARLAVDTLRERMVLLVDPGGVLAITKVPHRDTLSLTGLAAALAPSRTVRATLNGRLTLSGVAAARWFADPVIRPIMAAPRFNRAMYKALNDYNRDWLLPGLGLLPEADFVTVLSTNPEFMEAFLVGLSDEMGQELLWRGYPTDRRGTYFRRFWDKDEDELTQQIHAFSHTSLGKHVSFGGTGGSTPRAVIVVKSELIRRYPDVIIQVVRNQGTVADPIFEKVGSPQQTAKQLFAAHLEPDVALVGVDLSLEELDGPEWWITIAEHPTATRFDRPRDDQLPADRQFLTVASAHDAAGFAAARLHDPVRVAFQATDLIVTGG